MKLFQRLFLNFKYIMVEELEYRDILESNIEMLAKLECAEEYIEDLHLELRTTNRMFELSLPYVPENVRLNMIALLEEGEATHQNLDWHPNMYKEV